ncbi:MAG: HAD family hydrolase [Acidimicrobiales bacterium]
MPVRLFATDLDGTLLRSDNTVSDRTRSALAAAEAAGITIVMVTGRPIRWMHGLAVETGHHGLAICSNGALRYDLATDEILEHDPIPPAAGRAIVAALRLAVPGVRFAVEQEREFGREPSWEVREDPRGAKAVVALAEELVERPTSKLLARLDDARPDELVALVQAAIGDLATATHSSSWGLVEISAAGVSKATGLSRLADEMGISATDVVAVGDMPNDLPMLAWAGRPVAVANAHPDVLKACEERTGANDDDGVASLLERILAGAGP